MIRNILKVIIPTKLIVAIRCIIAHFVLIPEYVYWFYKDVWQSSLIPSQKSDMAALMVTSHVLEKGITMPNRRLGFGYDRVRDVIKRCSLAIKKYNENHIEIQIALNDLEQYQELHEKEKYILPTDIKENINYLLTFKHQEIVKCFSTTPNSFFENVTDFKDFANQRHSVRWYSEEIIDDETILNVIKLAQTAPSACNRQSTNVYVIGSAERKRKILEIQTGNRGFGFQADKILLLTADLSCWNYKQRSSAYLDSGVFLQNLLYSLHYYKICACTLNAHLSIKKRIKLRQIVDYKKSEIPIVFILIGKAPEKFMIAGSQRVNADGICFFR